MLMKQARDRQEKLTRHKETEVSDVIITSHVDPAACQSVCPAVHTSTAFCVETKVCRSVSASPSLFRSVSCAGSAWPSSEWWRTSAGLRRGRGDSWLTSASRRLRERDWQCSTRGTRRGVRVCVCVCVCVVCV